MSKDRILRNPDSLAAAVSKALAFSKKDSDIGKNAIYPPEGLDWPASLPKIIAYKSGDTYSSNITVESVIDSTLYTGRVYVDINAANDTANGLTPTTPKQKISSAKTVANSLGVPTKILVKGGIYPRLNGFIATAVTPTVPMIFEATNGRVVTGAFDALAWTLVATKSYVYQATRSNVAACYNPDMLDKEGFYTKYVWAASIDACEAAEGSWYTDNTTVYCHPHRNNKATNFNCRAYLTSNGGQNWNSNLDLLMRGFDFEGGNQSLTIPSACTSNKVVLDNCSFRYCSSSNLDNAGATYCNGVSFTGGYLAAMFNCSFDKNSKDGLNFSEPSVGTVLPSFIVVNCTAKLNGANGSTSNNGITAHDGIKGIIIGGSYTGSYGGNVAMTNDDTQCWCVGVEAGESLGDVVFGGTIYDGGFSAISGLCTLWLQECKDIGCNIGIAAGLVNGAASDTQPKIYLKDHVGTGNRLGGISNF